jgi:hypothetical protein
LGGLHASDLEPGTWGVPAPTEGRVLVVLAILSSLSAFMGLAVLPKRQTVECLEERHPGLSPAELVQEMIRAYAFRLASIEVIALCGFVLTVLTGKARYLTVGGGITVLLLLRLYPRRATCFQE